MGKVYRFLGLTVGLIIHDVRRTAAKQRMYAADITYGTNNEFGFDYLRDNMAIYKSRMVQRGHAFAIVDEVDSILIDEARTPLIISGRGRRSPPICTSRADCIRPPPARVPACQGDGREGGRSDDIDADYIVDEKATHRRAHPHRVSARLEEFFDVENLSAPEESDHRSTTYNQAHQGARHRCSATSTTS